MKATPPLVLIAALAVAACSKTPSAGVSVGPADAGAVSSAAPSVGAPAPSAAPPVLADGVHDYRGTLGKQAIAVHLVRKAGAVSGAYLYTLIGRPIALAGTIDTAGALALTETSEAETTGTLRLESAGTDLVGDWSDPKGSKTFPVKLSPGAAPASLLAPVDQTRNVEGTYRNGSSEIQIENVDGHTVNVLFDLVYAFQGGLGPSANIGMVSGEASLEGDSATYTSHEYGPCTIRMTFIPGNKMNVEQDNLDFECGFGHNVSARGTYERVSRAKPSMKFRQDR